MKEWGGSAVPSGTKTVCVYGSLGLGEDMVIVVFEDANHGELEVREMSDDAAFDLVEAWKDEVLQ